MISIVCITGTALLTGPFHRPHTVLGSTTLSSLSCSWLLSPTSGSFTPRRPGDRSRQSRYADPCRKRELARADTNFRILTSKELFDGPGAVSDLVNQELAVHPETLVHDKKGDADDEQLEYAKQ